MAGDAGDFYIAFAMMDDLCAEGLDAGEAAGGVCSGGEVGEAAGAFGEAGEQGVSVRDAFVAGQTEAALDVARGRDGSFGHREMQGGWTPDNRIKQVLDLLGRRCDWFGMGVHIFSRYGAPALPWWALI